jgi:hypothetical protein
MPKIAYLGRSFRSDSLTKIETANEIIAEYEALGMTLTLRQLYYQFVARDIIPNNQKEYGKLGNLLNKARLAGWVDWNALEDRTRFIRSVSHWSSPESIIQSAASAFRMDKWRTQNYHIEVLIEKDALVGVIETICTNLDVTYASCRGYMSQSMMWQMAMRLKNHALDGKQLLVIHLGDHDPSGIQMSEDIEDRLRLFLGKRRNQLTMNRIALNWEQIELYNPPPNPAKMTDPRSKSYIEEHGSESWELDALNPITIAGLIEEAVLSVRDQGLWDFAVQEESDERETLKTISDHYEDIRAFVEENY